MNKLHIAFFINLKLIFFVKKKCSLAVTIKQPIVFSKQPIVFSKQPIVFSKQPIVFPLTPLYNAAKFAYA